jgi:hypothetical protein
MPPALSFVVVLDMGQDRRTVDTILGPQWSR